MEYNVSQINTEYDFTITGVSFIGKPKDCTVLFVTKKVKNLLKNLSQINNCLVFIQTGLDIPEGYKKNNCFIVSDDPQLDYARFAVKLNEIEKEKDRKRKYTFSSGGFFIGENVKLGNNVVIEPGCRIGHDVIIGDNVFVGFGSDINNAEIGNDFVCQGRSAIGVDAFFMAEGEHKFRIPSFGKVYIGNNVDISSNVTIERGFNSHTIIKDNTKIDSNVCIGHDVVAGENVVITSGASIAGLVNIGKNVYIGMNATIKQRLNIGDGAMIGMGSVVISSVKDGISVFGNPAVKFGIKL